MPADPVRPDDVTAPSAESFAAADSDRWAALLPHVRAALRDVEDSQVTPSVARLRATPTSRLVSGRVRRELCALLARGGPVWDALVSRLDELDPLPGELAWVLDPRDPARAGTTGPQAGEDDGTRTTENASEGTSTERRDLERARTRLREARDERETWRRRAEGAEARAERLARELADTERELADIREELASAENARAEAGEERRRAVERERRRRDGELNALREQLSTLRRADEDRRTAERRRLEAREQAERDAIEAAEAARRTDRERGSVRVVPGRPSRLPRGVAPDTTEAARALLHAGRLVLVDGYNVTLQHRNGLDLETQRTWLIRYCATLATQRGVRPVVVFDGERAGGGRPPVGLREVEVRFTPTGISADDEVVLAVEGTDEPVLVVTDDRELRARVTVGGADVVGTRSFLGAGT